jgi:hypothetical protein
MPTTVNKSPSYALKLITPTFDESAPQNNTSHAGGHHFYEDSIMGGMAPKPQGDSDRHNLEYQECEAHPCAMLVAADDNLADAMQTPPMCFEELAQCNNSSFQRYQRRIM